MKRLYAEIAEVKEPFDRDNLWRMFAVWAVLRGYPTGLAPTRRKPNKDALMNYQSKSKVALIGWTNWE
jgi:hypothetical protein